jgi:hypothetical protein
LRCGGELNSTSDKPDEYERENMPALDWRVAFFRRAFLRHAARRYAIMLAPDEVQRLGQKYMERRGAITDAMIVRHLAGAITLAAPAAVDNRAHLLPLDIDAGGIDAIDALLAEIKLRELWAFGQYSLRQGLPEGQQRGYVWLPFDATTDAARLQVLGTQLIAAVGQPGWKVEPRAFHAVTRLPLARHTHTGRFGELMIDDQHITIDQDPAGALAELYDAYRENPVTELPQLPSPPQPATTTAPSQNGDGISITRYNRDNDVEDLIRFYGAKPTRRHRLYFCPFHEDEHASLGVYTCEGQRYCRCFSAHSDCPLAKHGRNDAFNVYCIGEGVDAKEALRRLNRRV